jgi:hypothetical protein
LFILCLIKEYYKQIKRNKEKKMENIIKSSGPTRILPNIVGPHVPPSILPNIVGPHVPPSILPNIIESRRPKIMVPRPPQIPRGI